MFPTNSFFFFSSPTHSRPAQMTPSFYCLPKTGDIQNFHIGHMTPDMTRGCFCCHQNCSQSKHQLFTLYNLKSLLAVQLCHKLVTLHSPSSTCFAVNTLPFSSVFLIQIFFRQQGETREEVSQFKLTLGLSRKIKK